MFVRFVYTEVSEKDAPDPLEGAERVVQESIECESYRLDTGHRCYEAGGEDELISVFVIQIRAGDRLIERTWDVRLNGSVEVYVMSSDGKTVDSFRW